MFTTFIVKEFVTTNNLKIWYKHHMFIESFKMSILRYLTGTKNNLPDGRLSRKILVREVLEDMHIEGKIKKHGEYIILPSELKLAKKLARCCCSCYEDGQAARHG